MTKAQEKFLALVVSLVDSTRVSTIEFHENGMIKLVSAEAVTESDKTVGFEAAGGTLIEMVAPEEEEDEEGDATAKRIGFK